MARFLGVQEQPERTRQGQLKQLGRAPTQRIVEDNNGIRDFETEHEHFGLAWPEIIYEGQRPHGSGLPDRNPG
jgi:hypothetical protein